MSALRSPKNEPTVSGKPTQRSPEWEVEQTLKPSLGARGRISRPVSERCAARLLFGHTVVSSDQSELQPTVQCSFISRCVRAHTLHSEVVVCSPSAHQVEMQSLPVGPTIHTFCTLRTLISSNSCRHHPSCFHYLHCSSASLVKTPRHRPTSALEHETA